MTRKDYERVAGVFANWTVGDHNTRWLLANGIADLMSKGWTVDEHVEVRRAFLAECGFDVRS